MMFDVLLDQSGDLLLRDGDIVLTQSVTQAIKIRLKWFLSEWRFDTSLGVPYYEQIFIKGYNIGLIEQALKKQIMNVEEVVDVPYLKAEVDIHTRQLKVRYKAKVADGVLEEEEVILNG